jgi:beta-glucosidase-like glycosyl hydrolase
MNPGRLIIPALRARPDGSFTHEADTIRTALEVGAGGFIIFGGNLDSVRTLTADLVRRAGRQLLIASDLERGPGQQVEGLTELPPPAALAWLGDPDVIRWAGALTAAEARSVGINWVFAPVADLDVLPTNPIVQTRAFGADPQAVAACVRGWVEGCETTGALACAKHYPGHGRTAIDSHVALPSVADGEATLRDQDERPFADAIAAGVASVMTAHVAYPALDPSGLPATLSAPILARLRGRLGFDGIIVTDALIMEGALSGQSEGAAAVSALAAGVDVLLYPSDAARVCGAVRGAARSGALSAERLADAERRYEVALARAMQAPGHVPAGPYESAGHLADALIDRGLVHGVLRGLEGPIELVVVDDDLGGPYAPSPSDYLAKWLGDRGLSGTGGARVVLVFAEPRAWKGRGGLGPAALELLAREAPSADLIVLFGHPRLAAEIPGGRPLLLAWHRQRLMQEAVGRWIAASVL